jgi:hypothetical protein
MYLRNPIAVYGPQKEARGLPEVDALTHALFAKTCDLEPKSPTRESSKADFYPRHSWGCRSGHVIFTPGTYGT